MEESPVGSGSGCSSHYRQRDIIRLKLMSCVTHYINITILITHKNELHIT